MCLKLSRNHFKIIFEQFLITMDRFEILNFFMKIKILSIFDIPNYKM